jgi:hypothetical protein
MRLSAVLAAGLTAAVLTGCNAPRQTQPVIDPPGPAQTGAGAGPALPAGATCSEAISRYRSVMDNDRSMGHVNASVYSQVEGEIAEAAAACAAGQDAKAVSLVRASKARHGYPGG